MTTAYPTRTGRIASAWHVYVPIVVLVAMCMPRIGLLLPAPIDFSDEIYQPMQTLKFAASRGKVFDKYGPTPNFLLLPVYGATMAYWKVTGDFGKPSNGWPFGFKRPVEQLGTLVLETRLLMLALTCVMLGVVASQLARTTGSPMAAMLACLLLAVGNYNVLWHAPLARPDTVMLVFLGLALAVVLRCATDRVTRRRGIALGLFAAAAVGAKENAAEIFVLTYLALAVWCLSATWRDRAARVAVLRGIAWAAGTGAVVYVTTNVLLSPRTWVQRVKYWTVGDGLSGDVWSKSATWADHVAGAARAFFNNLGLAGTIVAVVLIIVAFMRKPRLTLLMLVPFAAVVLTVMRIPYTPDRFVLPGAFALVIPAAIGLAELLATRGRKTVIAAMLVACGLNLWWGTVTWHLAATTEQAMAEQAARSIDKSTTKAFAVMIPDWPGAIRLEALGHPMDKRPMQAWIDASQPRPTIVLANAGRVQMVEEAKHMPGRVAYYKRLGGFDLAKWPGMSGLGYGEPERVRVPLPAYLRPWAWMPLTETLRHREVLVYRLK